MGSPPAQKRQKISATISTPPKASALSTGAAQAASTSAAQEANTSMAPPPQSPANPRKRRASQSTGASAGAAPAMSPTSPLGGEASTSAAATPSGEESGKKKGRTNTPWTPAEEQRLKTMRDAGLSWGEIAKSFPSRTEGSVKKHWYKDMHYAEFGEDESIALREAIREYEANKWKVIGQKVGKPAKACEQYAKEHFKTL